MSRDLSTFLFYFIIVLLVMHNILIYLIYRRLKAMHPTTHSNLGSPSLFTLSRVIDYALKRKYLDSLDIYLVTLCHIENFVFYTMCSTSLGMFVWILWTDAGSPG